MIRQLKEEGVSMVYISHRMNEILEICDRVTVIRDGKKVITEKVENLTMEEIVAQMMGNEAKETKFEYVPREYDCNAEDLLTVKHLKINDKIDDINFSIKPGQILGLAGLMGAGRTEIMETLFGLRKAVSGSIELEGKKVEIKNTFRCSSPVVLHWFRKTEEKKDWYFRIPLKKMLFFRFLPSW